MPYTKGRINEALIAIEGGMPVATAAKEYSIPRTTLRHRISSSTSHKERDSHQKLLSNYQEKILAYWIKV